MPNAVTHVLIAIVLAGIFRDFFVKDKKSFPLSYVFWAGVAGLLPDIDVPLYWLVHNFLKLDIPNFHRGFTHSIMFGLAFMALALLLGSRRKISNFLWVFAFGVYLHILLDFVLIGEIMPFYPFVMTKYGLHLFEKSGIFAVSEGIDALILLGWLCYIEYRHRISDFV
ncbi:metal-dependent hydrolase [Candidatus Woesearchaeota archaeon]|nr:metal-dependent hydrolase [Candidatus Woesearchaeota archaeon]